MEGVREIVVDVRLEAVTAVPFIMVQVCLCYEGTCCLCIRDLGLSWRSEPGVTHQKILLVMDVHIQGINIFST
jgi:hypothetical protein